MILSIQHSMQADLQSASEWFQSNGIGLYVDKCLSIWVGSNSEDLPLQLGNRNLQLSSSMKLLGITIDNALNFHGHVSELVSMSPGLILQTTVYGLHFFCYSACKLWNSLPNSFRTAHTTNAVNHLIKFNHDCCSFCNLA